MFSRRASEPPHQPACIFFFHLHCSKGNAFTTLFHFGKCVYKFGELGQPCCPSSMYFGSAAGTCTSTSNYGKSRDNEREGGKICFLVFLFDLKYFRMLCLTSIKRPLYIYLCTGMYIRMVYVSWLSQNQEIDRRGKILAHLSSWGKKIGSNTN